MKTILVTLCVGKDRIPQTLKFIKTFNQFTDYDIAVITDTPSSFDKERAKVIKLSDITKMAPFVGPGNYIFNYNLKGVVTNFVYDTQPKYDRIIWSDCDVFLENHVRFLTCIRNLIFMVYWERSGLTLTS